MRVYVVLWVWDIDQVKQIFSRDTDTNVYSCLVTANKVGFCCCLFVCFCWLSFYKTDLYWCILLIHVVVMITVRSVWYHLCEKTLNKKRKKKKLFGLCAVNTVGFVWKSFHTPYITVPIFIHSQSPTCHQPVKEAAVTCYLTTEITNIS